MNEASQPSQPSEHDVVDKALHTFDHVLDVVHDRVLRPVLIAGKTVAFGFILLLMGLVLVTVLVIGALRVMNVYLFAGHEWLSYAIVGAISVTIGLVLWRRRRPIELRK